MIQRLHLEVIVLYIYSLLYIFYLVSQLQPGVAPSPSDRPFSRFSSLAADSTHLERQEKLGARPQPRPLARIPGWGARASPGGVDSDVQPGLRTNLLSDAFVALSHILLHVSYRSPSGWAESPPSLHTFALHSGFN